MNGNRLNSCNWTNMINKECLATQSKFKKAWLYFIWYGHMLSRRWTLGRKHNGRVMDHLGQDKWGYWMKLTHIASIKPVPVSFMLCLRLKTSSLWVPMSQMLLRKLLPQSKVSIFIPIGHSENSGWSIRRGLRSQTVELSQYYRLCKGIWNHLDYGKSMRTQYYANVGLCQQYMNRACTPVLWKEKGWFSNVRLTTLLWLLLTSRLQMFSWTWLTISWLSQWNVKDFWTCIMALMC